VSSNAQAPAVESPTVPCIARQPILASNEQVCGYELFFRESYQERAFNSNAEAATRATVDSLSLIGLDVLCDGHTAFINWAGDMMLKDYLALLPLDQIVVEVGENVPASQDTVDACLFLKNLGGRIALDNYVPGDARKSLLPHASFIKVDFQKLTPQDRIAAVKSVVQPQCLKLAQKVETREDFVTSQKEGFTHFQGYFFRRPQTFQSRRVTAQESVCIRLLQAVEKPQMDAAEIEGLIKQEPSLCYRLLRYMNSPLHGLPCAIQSVKHAISLLGEKEAKRWIRTATALVVGQGKPSDLVLSSLVRARFCELLGAKVNHGDSDLFLLGMLSLMDAMLEAPIGMIVSGLALDPDTKAQLLAAKTGVKTPLSPIYELMLVCEAGNWETVASLGKELNLSLYSIAGAYNNAMRWAHTAAKTDH
jgi:EAL and modified HD-GYP domain-containing signal transduction protein